MKTWVKCTKKQGRDVYVNLAMVTDLYWDQNDSLTKVNFGTDRTIEVQQNASDIIKGPFMGPPNA